MQEKEHLVNLTIYGAVPFSWSIDFNGMSNHLELFYA